MTATKENKRFDSDHRKPGPAASPLMYNNIPFYFCSLSYTLQLFLAIFFCFRAPVLPQCGVVSDSGVLNRGSKDEKMRRVLRVRERASVVSPRHCMVEQDDRRRRLLYRYLASEEKILPLHRRRPIHWCERDSNQLWEPQQGWG